MARYLSPELVLRSFSRLRPRVTEGKIHLERCSAIMYFLAFDATCRRFDLTVLDVNPQTTTGKTARQQLQLEFAKLSSVKSLSGVPRQVSRFGEIDEGGISPEKRMSSNFLTVPVTRATTPVSYTHLTLPTSDLV